MCDVCLPACLVKYGFAETKFKRFRALLICSENAHLII